MYLIWDGLGMTFYACQFLSVKRRYLHCLGIGAVCGDKEQRQGMLGTATSQRSRESLRCASEEACGFTF